MDNNIVLSTNELEHREALLEILKAGALGLIGTNRNPIEEKRLTKAQAALSLNERQRWIRERDEALGYPLVGVEKVSDEKLTEINSVLTAHLEKIVNSREV